MTHYEVNVFGVLLLIIILISMNLRKELRSLSSRLFRFLIFAVMAVLVLETISYIVDTREGDLYYILNYASNFLLLLIAPLIATLWTLYIDYKINGDYKRLERRIFYLHPFLIGLVFSIINIFTPILFYIDSNNLYHRAPFIWVNLLTTFLLLMHTFYMALAHRKQINRNILITVVSFSFLPVAAAVIQLSTTGLALLWSSTALSLLLVFLLLETQSHSIDYLTGLYTRVKLDEYLKRLVRKEKEFAVIMIDLDNFKHINDKLGHTTGDKALVKFGHVLKDVFSTSGLVSRYGGDEFIVIMLEKNDSIIKAYINQIKEHINRSNDEVLSLVRFSSGYTIKTLENDKDFESLLIESDNLMYEDKARNKNKKRRKGD